METFWNDLRDILSEYYAQAVALVPKLALGVVLFVLFLFIANRTRTFSRKRLQENLEDPLLANFLTQVIRYTFILLGVFVFMGVVGLTKVAGGLLAGAGLSALIIGFAFKDIGENLLAGIMMAFKRPFRVGDTVEIGDVKGKIVGLTIRDTQIKTFDGKDVYVPNAIVIKNNLVNYTIDGFLRQAFTVGLDYGDDIPKGKDIILNSLEQINEVLQGEKSPSVVVEDLGTSTINLRVLFWINTFDPSVSGPEVKSKAIWTVTKALMEAGYYLPADILEVKSYQENVLLTKNNA